MDKLVQQLQSENELLQIQVQDLNYIIMDREEELQKLRKTAAYAVELQSRLDMNQDEFYQMQDIIGEQQHKAAGAAKREASLETELIQSITMETQLYNVRDELTSTKAALADMYSEVDKLPPLYKQLATLTARAAEVESNLEIYTMENGFLKEELEKYRMEEQSKNNNG